MATITQLLNNATAGVTGNAASISADKATFQVTGKTTSGTGAASFTIQCSNDKVNWLTLGALSLTLGTAETSEGFTSDAPWGYFRARLDSISGTGASVNAYMGG